MAGSMGQGSPQICAASKWPHSMDRVMPREPKAVNRCTPGAPRGASEPTTGRRSEVVQRTPAQLRKPKLLVVAKASASSVSGTQPASWGNKL